MVDTTLVTRQKAGRPYYGQGKSISRSVVKLAAGASPAVVMRLAGDTCVAGVGVAGKSNVQRTADIFLREVGTTHTSIGTSTINLLDGAANNIVAKGSNDLHASVYSVVDASSLGLDAEKEYELLVAHTGAALGSDDDLAAVVDVLVG